MATIYLSLSAKADTNPQKEIRIRFKHGSIDQQAKTNIFLPAEYWDREAQRIMIPNFRLMNDEKKQLKIHLAAQNEKLNALVAVVQTAFNDADRSCIFSDWLKLVIDQYNFPEKYEPQIEEEEKAKTLFQFVEHFIREATGRKDKNTGRPLTHNNIQQYKATEKHLKDFAKSMGSRDFDFCAIEQSFYDKFVSFLQGKEFTANSVGKHIRILKLMLNEATIQGYNTYNYYNSFHVFTEEIDNVYLTETELRQLKDKDFSKVPYLDRVRDWFLLLAWTGCRFSDLEKVGKTDIKDGFISFRQQKTNAKVTIPLHPVVLEVLEKYNYNLPEPISNQRFNEYVKEAVKLAEINSVESLTVTKGGRLVTEKYEKWELVSSHTGRRSFCTNMYKRGLPTLMIMSISGHKTEKSFLKYIKVKQNEHAEMMKKAWEDMYKSNK
ncbi:Site-specific recombinase XerD [Bacteroidales bacterium Barb7]|nr:Site-specific recombinase XerD [Bacteroidales bacterium Barb7]